MGDTSHLAKFIAHIPSDSHKWNVLQLGVGTIVNARRFNHMKYWTFIGKFTYPKKKQVIISDHHFGSICSNKMGAINLECASSGIFFQVTTTTTFRISSEVCGGIAVSRALGKKRCVWKPKNGPKKLRWHEWRQKSRWDRWHIYIYFPRFCIYTFIPLEICPKCRSMT